MLRFLLGEERRIDDGILLQTNEAISRYSAQLSKRLEKDPDAKRYTRLSIWATGLKNALNELEQSKYCSERYRLKVNKCLLEEMDIVELDEYRLHVYFYKNTLIRVFSTLDKLGNFMNELLELETEKKKERFSYFTVLRHMYREKSHPTLEKALFKYKVNYQDAMIQLRRKRNMEIHYLNAEMLDDLKNLSKDLLEPDCIEDLVLNMSLLQEGYNMVCYSLQTVFTYCNDTL